MFPIRQMLASSQAEDISLTMAIFYELDSLSSLKSCTSFPAVLCIRAIKGKHPNYSARKATQPKIPHRSVSHALLCSPLPRVQRCFSINNPQKKTGESSERLLGSEGPHKPTIEGNELPQHQAPSTQGCTWMGAGAQHRAPKACPASCYSSAQGHMSRNQPQTHQHRWGCSPPPSAGACRAPAQKQHSIFPWHAGFLALKEKKKKKVCKAFIAPFHLIFNVQEFLCAQVR